MGVSYYRQILGVERGPFSEHEIIEMARNGELTRDDLLRDYHQSRWDRADDYPLTSGYFDHVVLTPNSPDIPSTVHDVDWMGFAHVGKEEPDVSAARLSRRRTGVDPFHYDNVHRRASESLRETPVRFTTKTYKIDRCGDQDPISLLGRLRHTVVSTAIISQLMEDRSSRQQSPQRETAQTTVYTIELWNFGRPMTSELVLEQIRYHGAGHYGFRCGSHHAATIVDLLLFAAQYPDAQFEFRIAAMGTRWCDVRFGPSSGPVDRKSQEAIPCLTKRVENGQLVRRLTFANLVSAWEDASWFAVKKSMSLSELGDKS